MHNYSSCGRKKNSATFLFLLIWIGIDLLRRNVFTDKVLAFSGKMASQTFNSLKFSSSQILTNEYIFYEEILIS